MRAGPFGASGPPLRKSAIAGLILAVALPVPLMTASGLSIPLPAFAERMAVALAETVASQEPEKVAPAYRPVMIAHTAREQAVIDRAAAAIAPPSASVRPSSASPVAHRSSASKAAPVVIRTFPSKSGSKARADALPAVAASAVARDKRSTDSSPAADASPRDKAPKSQVVPSVTLRADKVPPGQVDRPAAEVPPGQVENAAEVPSNQVDTKSSGQGEGIDKVKP